MMKFFLQILITTFAFFNVFSAGAQEIHTGIRLTEEEETQVSRIDLALHDPKKSVIELFNAKWVHEKSGERYSNTAGYTVGIYCWQVEHGGAEPTPPHCFFPPRLKIIVEKWPHTHTVLKLRNLRLTSEFPYILEKAPAHIKQLDLSRNRLRSDNLILLLQALKRFPNLETLSLSESHCTIGVDYLEPFYESLKDFLTNCQELRELDLSNNAFNPRCVKEIKKIVKDINRERPPTARLNVNLEGNSQDNLNDSDADSDTDYNEGQSWTKEEEEDEEEAD